MVRWDKTQWIQLETAEKDKDGTYTYFEARTDSFSSFAITGLKGEAVPAATSAINVIETQAAPTITAKKTYGFEVIVAITILCAVYLLRRKRR